MKEKLISILQTNNLYATLPLRISLAMIMVTHGAQKLFGWWGGGGISGTGNFFENNLGLVPGEFWAALAGGTQFFGGLLVLIGLLTRPAAFAIAGTMAVAIITVHPDAFFAKDKGMEFPLSLLLLALGLVISGGGAWSVDRKISSKN
ncbi:MAG: DoxX family protein [Verrucomicrobiota bacterium]